MNKYIYTLIFILISCIGYSQNVPYTGVVKDSLTGNPLQGVTIIAKQSGISVLTNAQGQFRVKSKMRDTLVISTVGYQIRLIALNDFREPLTILLQMNDSSLQDVVVHTGYQSIPKERATGSFVQINNRLINRSVGPNILDRLKGVTSSLLFDVGSGHPPLTIRGIGTLSASSGIAQPLIIVDNFPYEGDINNINPNDVENITILRDAAAASIWGAKAGNGVIVITTKKARKNQPMHLTLNSNLTLKGKPDLFAQSQITIKDFIDVEKMLFENGFYDAKLKDRRTFPVLSPVVRILDQQRSGSLSSADAKTMIDALANNDVRNDYLKYFYRKENFQQYNINLSGGRENVAFLSSIGYDKHLGSEVGNKNDRITWRSNVIMEPLPKLQIQTNSIITWTRSKTNSLVPFNTGIGGALYPYATFVDANGEPVAIEHDYSSAFKDTAGNGRLLNWEYIPLDELKNSDNTSSNMDILLNTQATYDFLPVLKAEVKYQYERQGLNTRNYKSSLSYYTRNLINLYTMIDDDNVSYGVPMGGILDLSSSSITAHNLRGQLDYSQNISKHHIAAIIGGEIRQTSTKGNSSTAYGYNDNNLTYTNVNFVEQHQVLDGLNYTTVIPNNQNFTSEVNRVVSIYANASYNFDNRYTFSGSARRDASNIFGVSTNNKWKPLWSMGGAWTLSNEDFYKLGWLPFLKLRATYGYSGNVNNSISALTTLQYSSTNRTKLGVLPFAMVLNAPNGDLRWEQIRTINFATDFALLNNRLSGSIEYYSKKSTDVLSAVPIDITSGISSIKKNSADMQGKGLDLSLNALIINSGFRWTSDFILSYNKVVVTGTKDVVKAKGLISNGGALVQPVIGKAPYSIASYKWGGLNSENGNPIGYLDGEPSEDYRKIMSNADWDNIVIGGSAVPELFGGLRNTFGYKGLQLSFNITYKMLYYFRKSVLNYTGLFTGGTATADFAQRWQVPGDELRTNVPSMIYPANAQRDLFYSQSSINIESGDQIRLQDIRLSYDIKGKPNVSSLELYLYANNLGLIWTKNKDHLDPDAYKTYPQPTSWSIGCNIRF